MMNSNSIVETTKLKCQHPRAVKVVLTESTDADQERSCENWPEFLLRTEFMVTPELSLPKSPAIAGDAHVWKLNDYGHPFWVIPRDDDDKKWNCEVFHIGVTQAYAVPGTELKACSARAFNVTIPALHNTRPIKVGEAIVLKWPKPKEVPKLQVQAPTWRSSVKVATPPAKKRKTGWH